MFFNDYESSPHTFHGIAQSPWDDKCRHGDYSDQPSWLGESPYFDDQIGIMGWLLSCRQA
jgi:hypothetical protein